MPVGPSSFVRLTQFEVEEDAGGNIKNVHMSGWPENVQGARDRRYSTRQTIFAARAPEILEQCIRWHIQTLAASPDVRFRTEEA